MCDCIFCKIANHERMDRRLGIEVVEGDDLVVLIDNGRGDLVVGNFAEKTPVEQLTYKQASQELELIIRSLESGDMELEESLESYTRGVELLKSLLVRKLLDRGLLCHICFLS